MLNVVITEQRRNDWVEWVVFTMCNFSYWLWHLAWVLGTQHRPVRLQIMRLWLRGSLQQQVSEITVLWTFCTYCSSKWDVVCVLRCMMESGQCDCRRHLIGRQCSEVQPGYFCAPLDYYKYEAEDSTGHSPAESALPVGSSTFTWKYDRRAASNRDQKNHYLFSVINYKV